MYCIYLIYLLFAIVFVFPVSTNKSLPYGGSRTSPAIEARVYQGATNLLPPDEEGPPAQPIAPAEPEAPSTSWIMGVVSDWLPRGLGSSSLMGAAVSQPPAMGGFAKWLLGVEDSSDDKCDTKTKTDEGGSSKRSRDK
ncbi:hypothetical protein ABMA28_008598 [Loxostege sticticalis]|uniref:Uncharacterized protein n=1 Tax=Loxostege sticticalis TaxID=481309 RepID=A0ABD0SDZ0_LOXSC